MVITQDDLMDSPMILDDTIKFQSHLSATHEIGEEEDEDEEAVEAELDEDEKRKAMLAEQDMVLQSCLDYKDDILAYMRELEKENRPKASYMKKQQDINSSMRCILVDWLVEVCEEYRLNMETLYLAVNFTDRFLSQMSVLRGKLQLVGTASMYIASKYEEITPPDVAEFVYITDDTYTKKQVLRMEHLLLKVLDFKMNAPTANWFLSHYLRFGKRHFGLHSQEELHRVEMLARYAAELTLIDSDTFIGYLPSQIAASAVYLSLLSHNRPWTKQIADTLGYAHDLTDLKACIADMHEALVKAPTQPQQAVYEKYKLPKYEQVSLITPPVSLPAALCSSHSQQHDFDDNEH
jgi:cyclin A